MLRAKIISYKATPTARLFHASTAFVRGLMGPVGSGKSVACCFELYKKGTMQAPGNDGVRRSRVLVVRNTLPQLETTTIKTWLDWFPEENFGRMTRKPPYTQVVTTKLDDGTSMQMEVIFIALDKPDDVKKLLSLECTWIWFNEAKEMEREIVDAGTARVGRYPSVKDRPESLPASEPWPTSSGIIMDTNAPDDEHWWYKCAELNEWRKNMETGVVMPVESIPENQRWEFWKQPSGRSDHAENILNLPLGYYQKISVNKTVEWIKVFVDGDYGFVVAGKPVYEHDYNPEIHLAKVTLPIDSFAKVVAGVDCSGRNPAALFFQRSREGQYFVVHEFVCEDMGAESFAKLLKPEIARVFPKQDIEWWGDPAGFHKGNNDERTYVEILKEHAKIVVRPSPVLRVDPRIQAVKSAFARLVNAKPALLISPTCKVFVRGLGGGYKYRRMKVSGEAKYTPEPDKNRFSDVQDAAQYALCGMGEYQKMVGRERPAAKGGRRSNVAADVSSWKVFK